MNSSAGNNGYRKDTHIGWSVQFALNKSGYQTHKLIPFIEAGQCFDWTKVGFVDTLISFNWIVPEYPREVGPIFSIATQAGTGISYFPTSRIELCGEIQYMIHLTKDVNLLFDNSNVAYAISQEDGTSFDGHILGTISFTYYLFQKKS